LKWYEFSKKIGIELIILNNLEVMDQFFITNKIKGIILSGGGNLSCNFPKISKNKSSKNIDIERERVEKKIIELSLKQNIPLLGVCRGMQAIGMFFGSKILKVKNHVKSRHRLSYYCPITKKKVLRTVNSYHDYGFTVTSLSKDFEANAITDNVVEKMIHKKNNILCLMWHPERETNFSKHDLDLFKKFFNIKK
jgi:putative glutamine amidotransferase